MKSWISRFFAVDNSVNELTVMGALSWLMALGFGIAAVFTGAALIPMGSFLGFGATCFGLNWKYK